MVLSEILTMTPALRQAVNENAPPSRLRALAGADGTGGTLLDSGISALRDQRTSIAEVLAAVTSDEA